MARLSWQPQRRGHIYCSPACGGKCTWRAYMEAQRNAGKVIKNLGPKWKTRIWENLGWHFAANIRVKGRNLLEVTTVEGSKWMAFFNLPNGQEVAEGRTARAAVQKVLKQAETRVDQWQTALSKAKAALP